MAGVTTKRRWVSVIQFAKEIPISVDLVYQAIKEGQISSTRTPQVRLMIDAESQRAPFLSYHPKAVQAILENKRKLDEKKQQKDDLLEAAISDATLVQTVGEGLAVSKARKERALARKAELDAAEREGNLVDLQSMVRVWKTIAIQTRQAVMTIPDRLAPVMAGERDQHKCHRMLTEELTHALQTLSQNLRDVLLKEQEQDEVEIEDYTERETDNNAE